MCFGSEWVDIQEPQLFAFLTKSQFKLFFHKNKDAQSAHQCI